MPFCPSEALRLQKWPYEFKSALFLLLKHLDLVVKALLGSLGGNEWNDYLFFAC